MVLRSFARIEIRIGRTSVLDTSRPCRTSTRRSAGFCGSDRRPPPSPLWLGAMSYISATMGGFLRLESQRALVLIVPGDHEPAAAVSGRGASWNVPVHVIASRGAVLDHLIRRGFRPGLTPARESIGRMHALTPILLEAFGDKTDGHHAP